MIAVMTQLIMIIDIFPPGNYTVHPLAKHMQVTVDNLAWLACIVPVKNLCHTW